MDDTSISPLKSPVGPSGLVAVTTILVEQMLEELAWPAISSGNVLARSFHKESYGGAEWCGVEMEDKGE